MSSTPPKMATPTAATAATPFLQHAGPSGVGPGTSTSTPELVSGPQHAPPGTPASLPPQGVIPDSSGQSLVQQQQEGHQFYPTPQMQAAGSSPYPPMQQQQFYLPVQGVYQGQYQQSPQGQPMGYNQFSTAQFQHTYPQMQQGNPLPTQIYPPFPPQQQGLGQQPYENYGYNQGGSGGYPPQGMQGPYNSVSGGYLQQGMQGPYNSVSGGYLQQGMQGPYNSVSGGYLQQATGQIILPQGYPPILSSPYIPPTVGYNTAIVEEAPLHMYSILDCIGDVKLIVKAFSSMFNTDEGALIQVLSKRSHPLEIASRKRAYTSHPEFSKNKSKELADITNKWTINFSGGFKSLTHAMVVGPLEFDVFLLREAIEGPGTTEQYLDMVLLCRSNEDIKAISKRYPEASSSSKTLLKALEGDLSGDVLELYKAVLLAERSYEDPTIPIPKEELERSINSLFTAFTGKVDVQTVITFFIHGSFHRLASINREWENVTKQKSLKKYIKDSYFGHMKAALAYILLSAQDRTLAQATMLDKSLKSNSLLGHKDEEIALQVAKLVWEDQLRVGSAKTLGGSYARGDFLKEVDVKYASVQKKGTKKGTLLSKIKSKTSGDFQTFLVSLWENQKD